MCKTNKFSKARNFAKFRIIPRNVFEEVFASRESATQSKLFSREQTELRDIFRGQRDKQTPLTTPGCESTLSADSPARIVHRLDDGRVERQVRTRFPRIAFIAGKFDIPRKARSVELPTSDRCDKVHGRRRRRRHHRRLGCRRDAASRRRLYERT